jgi:hypothetical protein
MPIFLVSSTDGHRSSATRRSAQAQNFVFGSTALLSCEDGRQWKALCDGYRQELQPSNMVERRYVDEMIDAEWRLNRIRSYAVSIQESCMEKLASVPTAGTAAQAFQALADTSSLRLLLRYESQFRRQYDKALEYLQRYRRNSHSETQAAEKKPPCVVKAYQAKPGTC